MKITRAVSVAVWAMFPVLTGCFRTTHTVQMTHPPAHVLDATLDQLLNQTSKRYTAIQTMTAAITIITSTGGSRQGSVTEYTSVPGHILMRKPEDLRVLLTFAGMRAVDMITDGKTFTMVIPHYDTAIEDSNNEPPTPAKNPLYNLRPQMFFDSMFVRGQEPGELVSLTKNSRVYQPNAKKKDLVDEPDYDVNILRQKGTGSELQTLRVIHIGRSNLLPYEQDIYDDAGQLVTQASYEGYQQFGDINYPTKITIERPVDQLKIVVILDPTKLILNQKLDDEQFQLTVPANYKICVPSKAPCSL